MHKYDEPNHVEDYPHDLARFFTKNIYKIA